MQQNVDPRQAGIDWAQFREAQREPARGSGGQRPGAGRDRPPGAALRSRPKMSIRRLNGSPRGPGGRRRRCGPSSRRKAALSRLYAGLRREKAVDLALSRATMTGE